MLQVRLPLQHGDVGIQLVDVDLHVRQIIQVLIMRFEQVLMCFVQLVELLLQIFCVSSLPLAKSALSRTILGSTSQVASRKHLLAM